MKNFSKADLTGLANDIGRDKVSFNEPLKNHTWIKIGGPADLFFVAQSFGDLLTAVSAAVRRGIAYTVLGGGSNVLVKDGGIRGLTIKNRADKISFGGFKGKVKGKKAGVDKAIVKAESGAIVNQLVRFSLDESLGGLEEFLGIPGTVGGAIYNNSHHLTHLIGDYVSEVSVVGEDGKEKIYKKGDLKFAYDYSVLQKTNEVVLWASFLLKAGDKADLWKKAEAALKRRRDTQPLEKASSGCMFKNIGEANAILYNTPNRSTSAGFLIDKAGLKGLKVGGAIVSEKHANFILNTDNAKAKDVMDLSNLVIEKIKEKYGVPLEREVFFIGED
jgi:UDP-N-acetylmuramate dehydrogenase